MRKQCSRMVYRIGGSFRGSSCQKKATACVNGQWFCSTHSPDGVKARQERMDAKYKQERIARDAKYKRDMERADRVTAMTDFCADVDTETIRTFTSNGQTLKAWINESGKP